MRIKREKYINITTGHMDLRLVPAFVSSSPKSIARMLPLPPDNEYITTQKVKDSLPKKHLFAIDCRFSPSMRIKREKYINITTGHMDLRLVPAFVSSSPKGIARMLPLPTDNEYIIPQNVKDSQHKKNTCLRLTVGSVPQCV